MEDYNRLISSRILDGYEEMLDTVPQPQMLGGKRMRNFVLPGSTEYDYPGTLSVGTMDGKYANTVGGSFFKDFNRGFHQAEDLAGGASHCGMEGGAVWVGADGKIHSVGQVVPAGNPRRVGGKKLNLGKALKSVGKEVAPVAKELGMTLAKEGIKEGVKSYAKGSSAKTGGKFNLGKTLKSVGKAVAPVAKDVGMSLAKEGIKEGVKSYAKGKGGRRKKSILSSVGKTLKSVGKAVAPYAKEVFDDVIVPEGKKALREYIKGAMKPSATDANNNPNVAYGKGRKPRMPKMVGTDPRTYTPVHLLAQGGVLIRDEPSQFHSSVYPPALASYHAKMPRGQDAYGRGRDEMKLPKSAHKRYTARGAIVAEVMKKHGLNLAQASKFVKEKGLY